MKEYFIQRDKVQPVSEICLSLALDVYNDTSNKEQKQKSEKILVDYVMYDLVREGRETCTLEEVSKRVGDMVADHCLNKLANDGLCEVLVGPEGEIEYILNEKGAKAAEEIVGKLSNKMKILKKFGGKDQ